MSLLGRKQEIFAGILLPKLLSESMMRGYRVRIGEAHRPDWVAVVYEAFGKGISASLHRKKLAIDLDLFLQGEYLTETDAYRSLGEWWEAQTGAYEGLPIKCCWGGRFGDGRHFSIEHEGVR